MNLYHTIPYMINGILSNYPLVISYSSLLNMAHFEIVDLPNFKMVDLSI